MEQLSELAALLVFVVSGLDDEHAISKPKLGATNDVSLIISDLRSNSCAVAPLP
jgi:hypothetical protein